MYASSTIFYCFVLCCNTLSKSVLRMHWFYVAVLKILEWKYVGKINLAKWTFLTSLFITVDGLRSSEHRSIRLIIVVACFRGRKSSILFFFHFCHYYMIGGAGLTVEWHRTHLHCGMWLRIFDLRRVPSNYLSPTWKKPNKVYCKCVTCIEIVADYSQIL